MTWTPADGKNLEALRRASEAMAASLRDLADLAAASMARDDDTDEDTVPA